ncbi:MAG: sigma-54-dependent transcriptional regulator, partial [Planctomycetota bacterium]
MGDADDRKTPPPKEAGRGAKPSSESGETGRVIVVDDEANIRRVLQVMLEADGHTVFTTDDGREVLRKIVEESWDVIIGDVQMPKMHGHELLRELGAVANPPLVLVITAYSTWDDAVEAMRLGAHDYIRKPFDNDHIRATVARAIHRRRLLERLAAEGVADRPRLRDILGNSDGIREVLRFILRAAPTDSTVLILGESGTGKELVARAVHYSSLRAQGPFIPVNCGAFTE